MGTKQRQDDHRSATVSRRGRLEPDEEARQVGAEENVRSPGVRLAAAVDAWPELRVVSDDVWNAVHARLDGVRKRQRHVAGNVGYRRDVESKYLLSGFARCAVCGASFYPLSRSHGKQRAYFYGCSAHHKRGSAVCGNNLVQRMEKIDDAVLRAIGGDVLRPAVIMAVVEGVIAELSPVSRKRTIDRQRKDLVQIDGVGAWLLIYG